MHEIDDEYGRLDENKYYGNCGINIQTGEPEEDDIVENGNDNILLSARPNGTAENDAITISGL